MYKVIAICGKAGSGKDTIMKKVLAARPSGNLHEIVSHTTRPVRQGEQNGINYHFCSNEEFAELVANGKMLESTCFNNWFYGTSLAGLDENKINIGVFNPAGIDALDRNPDVDCWVYYILATPKTRLLRQLNREENPDVFEIIRRFQTDNEDFSHIKFTFESLENETKGDMEEAVKTIVGRFDELNT